MREHKSKARSLRVFTANMPPSRKSSSKKKKAKRKTSKGASAAQLKRELARIPSSRKYKRKVERAEIKHAGEGRGSATRGARAVAPQKGTERHKLSKKKAKSKKSAKGRGSCYFEPRLEKFPMCETDGVIDERLLRAAYMRARQNMCKYGWRLKDRIARRIKAETGEYPPSWKAGPQPTPKCPRPTEYGWLGKDRNGKGPKKSSSKKRKTSSKKRKTSSKKR